MNEGEGVFQDAKIVWVMAMRAGKLLGFVKALKTKHELFIDEALVAAEERGKPHGLNTHMFRLLAQAIAGWLCLQVRETKTRPSGPIVALASTIGQREQAHNSRASSPIPGATCSCARPEALCCRALRISEKQSRWQKTFGCCSAQPCR